MNNITISIYWIRHGFSCANLLYESGYSGIFDALKRGSTHDTRGELAPDAKLLNKTIHNICANNEHFKKAHDVDAILCSELTRATETALFAFRNETPLTVYISPYISEKRSIIGTDYDNVPSHLNILKNNINEAKKIKCDDLLQFPNINFDIIEHYRPTGDNPTTPDFNKFLQEVIPLMFQKNIIQPKNNIKLAIVSHGHFIKDVTGIGNDISNLDIIYQELTMDISYKIKNIHKKQIDKTKCSSNISDDTCVISKTGKFNINDIINDAERCGEKVIKKIKESDYKKKYEKYSQKIQNIDWGLATRF